MNKDGALDLTVFQICCRRRLQVSLIEMSDEAEIMLNRVAMDSSLLQWLKQRAYARARSHGNYLPALDAAIELLLEDASRQSQLFLVFLSDGAPSDHIEMVNLRMVPIVRAGRPHTPPLCRCAHMVFKSGKTVQDG
jgi:hypothetical protein